MREEGEGSLLAECISEDGDAGALLPSHPQRHNRRFLAHETRLCT